MIPFFRYEYQGQIFDNYWNVKKFEQDNNVFVPFVTDYSLYKQALQDRLVDLNRNYDLEYLQHLRKTKSYIRLYYSGGLDSDAILKIAIDHSIFIDEIVVVTRNLYNKDQLQSCDIEIIDQVVPVLKKLTTDQVGKITFKNFDAEFMRNLYQDPKWMFNIPGGDIGFRITQFDIRDLFLSDCQIVGLEKPSIVYYKNRWFATVLDIPLVSRAFLSEVCLFYMMPDNIKSFVAKAIHFKNQIIASGETFNKNFHFFSSLMYYDLELNPGKYKDGKFLNKKDHNALQEVIVEEDFDLLNKWHQSIAYLGSVFPDIKNKNSYYKCPTGKFLWFIDLETLEMFSQHELIPNGFEH